MATKRICVCDRCGAPVGWVDRVFWYGKWYFLGKTVDGSLHTYDLCYDCWKKLGEFIDGAEVVRRDEECITEN